MHIASSALTEDEVRRVAGGVVADRAVDAVVVQVLGATQHGGRGRDGAEVHLGPRPAFAS